MALFGRESPSHVGCVELALSLNYSDVEHTLMAFKNARVERNPSWLPDWTLGF